MRLSVGRREARSLIDGIFMFLPNFGSAVITLRLLHRRTRTYEVCRTIDGLPLQRSRQHQAQNRYHTSDRCLGMHTLEHLKRNFRPKRTTIESRVRIPSESRADRKRLELAASRMLTKPTHR